MDSSSPITIDLSAFPTYLSRSFQPLLWSQARYLCLMGGASSGKSKSSAAIKVYRALAEPGQRFLVLRKVARTLRASCWLEIRDWIDTLDVGELFRVNKSDMTITCRNGTEIFFAGCDDAEKLKSYASPTSIWIEEPSELTEDEFDQIDLRCRGATRFKRQIILSYNPVSVKSWLKRRFHDTPDPRAEMHHSTYVDNEWLDDDSRRTIEGMRERNPSMWRVYGLGHWGDLRGLVFSPSEVVPEGEWPDCHDGCYGLDFGYSKPLALAEFLVHDRIYQRELLYETHLTNNDLIERMRALGVRTDRPIYCDSAEPKSIEELCAAGFLAIPATKGAGSVTEGSKWIQGLKRVVSPNSVNLIAEEGSYAWQLDKAEQPTDQPVKFHDHLMDARRYALVMHLRAREEERVIVRDTVEEYGPIESWR